MKIAKLKEKYFNWLCNIVYDENYVEQSYDRLLEYLHDHKFMYTIPLDENRASDGVYLRYRFMDEAYDILTDECSILEMMVALAIHCEDIMADADTDRTAYWFWNMVNSLGLSSMTDDDFDTKYVDHVIYRLLNHKYKPYGKYGLFTVYNCEYDLRNEEIWKQMMVYLSSI